MLSVPNEKLDDGIVNAAVDRMDLRGQLFGDIKPVYMEVIGYLRESHKPAGSFADVMGGIK